jgi:hypothetical protein
MVDWQITAATIYCEDVDDEVTVIVQRDGTACCVGFTRYGKMDKDTARMMEQKSRRLQRRLECTGPECHRVTDYRDRLLAEEAKPAGPSGSQ